MGFTCQQQYPRRLGSAGQQCTLHMVQAHRCDQRNSSVESKRPIIATAAGSRAGSQLTNCASQQAPVTAVCVLFMLLPAVLHKNAISWQSLGQMPG